MNVSSPDVTTLKTQTVNTFRLPMIADEPLRRWMKIEMARPSVHEAGHAVIARVLGFPVAWVSTDRAFIANDPVATENMVVGDGAVCMTISSDLLNPIVRKRRIETVKERELVIGYCMHVLAGPFADRDLDPETFIEEFCSNDYRQVVAMLNHVEPNQRKRRKLVSEAEQRLDKLLDLHWSTVLRLANALMQRSTLMSNEIDDLIFGQFEQSEAA